MFRGRRSARRAWRGRGRGCPTVDDVLAQIVARSGSLRIDRDRGAPVAASDRGRGFRSADGVGDEMAGVDAAVGAAAGAGIRPRQMAARVDPMPRRRKRGLCSGCV